MSDPHAAGPQGSDPDATVVNGGASSDGASKGLIIGVVVSAVLLAGAGAAYVLTLPKPGIAPPAAPEATAAPETAESDAQAEELVRQARIAELIGLGDEALDAEYAVVIQDPSDLAQAVSLQPMAGQVEERVVRDHYGVDRA